MNLESAIIDQHKADSHSTDCEDDSLNEYFELSIEEIHQRGREAKQKLGERLLILTHHYQQDDTFWFGDVSGDSLFLAQQAARTPAEFIVFCGVHFMAESSDIITGDNQITILPDLGAGCSMADMADPDDVEDCWEYITDIIGDTIIPITYINSAAVLKAFCAKHGGTVCTSSNSHKILKWALDQDKRVLFFPDQHLGRNTANSLGVQKEHIKLWNRSMKNGNLSESDVEKAQVILWDGYCSVHCKFSIEQINSIRKRRPKVKIIVHPECPEEIVDASDFSGSTNQIINIVTDSPNGSEWAVGTEINMVNRLAKELSEKDNKVIESLNPNVCICSTMYRVHPANVLWVLENLINGRTVNQISVPEPTKELAKEALDRMLLLSN